jgi:DNA-binding transcriptional ArsR family regulator
MAKPAKSPETIKLDFETVAKHYGVKPTQRREREVLKALIGHEYITAIKVAQQNTAVVNMTHNTLTSTLSKLKAKGVVFGKSRDRDSNDTLYTRYHLDRAKVARDMAATPG